MNTIQVQVLYSEELEDGTTFTDAIYYPIDEWETGKVSEEDIEAEKAIRIANYEEVKSTPQPAKPDEEKLEDVENDIASLEKQLAELTEKKTELEEKVEPEEKVDSPLDSIEVK